MSSTYEEMALDRSRGTPYMTRVFWPDGMRHVFLSHTIAEAIDMAIGCERAELYYASFENDEFLGRSTEIVKLAEVWFGGWLIEENQKELTMAKVKDVQKNGSARDVADDLIGTGKGKGKKAGKSAKGAKAAAGTGRGRAPTYSADQRVKRLKKFDLTPREGSKLDITIKTYTPGMTIGEWNKARKKGGMANPGLGLIRKLVNDGYIVVK